MANYEVLEPGGHAALVDGLKDYADREGGTDTEQLADGSVEMDKLGDDVLDELDSKAYADGYYAQMTVGAADNLTGRGDATTAEFLYRTAGGTADIETGQASIKSIKGNTLRWNQMVTFTAGESTITGVTCTRGADGSLTYSGTASAGGSIDMLDVNLVNEHKYLYSGFVGQANDHWVNFGGLYPITSEAARLFTYTREYPRLSMRMSFVSGAVFDNLKFYPQLFDLTTMFGAGSEPSTIEEFEALYPLPYYEYDAGSLLSVNMDGIETTGFNQWDGTFKSGNQHFNHVTGVFDSGGGWKCTDKIPAFPDTVYYVRADLASDSTSSVVVGCWDADDNYLGYARYSTWNGTTNATKPNTAYIRAEWTDFSKVSDICINLSWSGRRNGEYEPFWSSQREIAASTYFPNGMRSAGTVRDELTSTEAITRVGVVAMNETTWTQAGTNVPVFYLDGTSLPNLAKNNSGVCVECAAYTPVASVSGAGSMTTDMTVSVGSGDSVRMYVRDERYSTQAEFNAATTDALIFYPLATPVITPIDPALNLSYRVDDFGTERVMVPEDERSAPPVLDIAYGLNVVDFVRRAPTEYISHASMSQFRLALMSHLGVFINETWDEVDNRYEYTITSE